MTQEAQSSKHHQIPLLIATYDNFDLLRDTGGEEVTLWRMRSGANAVKDFKASRDVVLSTMFVAISRLQCNAPCLRGWRFSCSCKSLRINLSQSLVPWTSSNPSRHSTQHQRVSFLVWAPFFSFILVRFMLHKLASYALFSFMRCYQIPVHMLYVKWNLCLFILGTDTQTIKTDDDDSPLMKLA